MEGAKTQLGAPTCGHSSPLPHGAFQLYAPSGQLGELRALVDSGSASGGDRALACLNHLVADALTLAPACLSYLAALKNRGDVFRFCAIPQVMAIATLAKVVNNRDVFTGVVKIRKGKALVLLTGANDMQVGAGGVRSCCSTKAHSQSVASVGVQDVSKLHARHRCRDTAAPRRRPCNRCGGSEPN